MEEKIIENFENFFNDQLLKDYKDKIRTKFYKDLDGLLMLHLALSNQMDRSTQPLNLYFYNKPSVCQILEYHRD